MRAEFQSTVSSARDLRVRDVLSSRWTNCYVHCAQRAQGSISAVQQGDCPVLAGSQGEAHGLTGSTADGR